MKKKLLGSILACVMMAGALGACGAKAPSTSTPTAPAGSSTAPSTATSTPEVTGGDFTAAMVTDVGGVNDESFNQSAWDGMERLEAEIGANISFIESHKDADFIPNLEKATDGGADIIWGIGFLMKDAMRTAAEQNPEQLYALVDDSFEDGELPNVISVIFQAEQSSFLVGYAAALKTETDHVGFIVGMEGPTMNRFRFGYMAGVQYGAKQLGKDIKVDYVVVESFADSAKGKAMALKMYSDGADVIFHAAGQSGTGVIEAAKEQNKMVIGVDLDQNKLAPDNVITSSLKNVSVAVFEVSSRSKDGEKLGGTTILMGLKEGGVGLSESSNIHLSAEILADCAKAEKEIVDGKMTVPYTQADYDTFIAGL